MMAERFFEKSKAATGILIAFPVKIRPRHCDCEEVVGHKGRLFVGRQG
jgi:hypothetical protein